MTGRNLHKLVLSLRAGEKRYFIQQIDRDSSFATLYYILNKQIEFDESAASAPFSSNKKYYNARDYLAGQIIQNLAAYHARPPSSILMDKLLLRPAAAMILKNLTEATQAKDLDSILSGHCDIEILSDLGLSVELPAQVMRAEEALGLRLKLDSLKTLNCRIRKAFGDDMGRRTRLYDEIYVQLNGFRPICKVLNMEYYRLRTGLAILLRDTKETIAWQEKVVGAARNNHSKIIETGRLTRMLTIDGAVERASRLAMKMNAIPAETKAEEQLKLKYWISNGAAIGLATMNIKLCEQIFAALPASRYLFTEKTLALYFHNASLIQFLKRDFKAAIAWNREIEGLEAKTRKNFIWQYHMMRCLIHFELGNHDLLELLLAAAMKAIGDRSAFAVLVISTLSQIISSPSVYSTEIWTKSRTRYEAMKSEAKNSELVFFAFDRYCESKMTGVGFHSLYSPTEHTFPISDSA